MFCQQFASIFNIGFTLRLFYGSNIGMLLIISRLKAENLKIKTLKTILLHVVGMRTWSNKFGASYGVINVKTLVKKISQIQMHTSAYTHG